MLARVRTSTWIIVALVIALAGIGTWALIQWRTSAARTDAANAALDRITIPTGWKQLPSEEFSYDPGQLHWMRQYAAPGTPEAAFVALTAAIEAAGGDHGSPSPNPCDKVLHCLHRSYPPTYTITMTTGTNYGSDCDTICALVIVDLTDDHSNDKFERAFG